MATIGDIAKLPPALQAVAKGKRVTIDKHGELVQKDTKLEREAAELRQERKRVKFAAKWQQAAATYDNINKTEGCRMGRKDARKLDTCGTAPVLDYGRIAKQTNMGIPLDQKGSRVVDVDFWREHMPVNGQIPSKCAPRWRDGAQKTRMVRKLADRQGLQVRTKG